MELHVVMEKLFQERPKTITQGNPIPQVSSSTNPNLPLVLYHPPDKFFIKLQDFSKLSSTKSTVHISTSNSDGSGIS